MEILLTNDDGIYAPGLWALHDSLARRHRVTVVAPDRERSAVSHGITLDRPLRAESVSPPGTGLKSKIKNPKSGGGHAVNGTPADCVKLGILEILGTPPDLVIAGINPGANVGISIHYSGTVSAAREGALYGVCSLAVSMSCTDGRVRHYDDAARFVRSLAETAYHQGLPFGTLLNVNIPDRPPSEIVGVRVSRQGVALITEYFEKRVDPRNRAYHWLGGDIQTFDDDLEIDWTALARDYITITPIKCDTTDYDTLGALSRWPGICDFRF
jgi:5'-nucleotidase